MNNYLLKFEADYADEFEVYGFIIVKADALGLNHQKIIESVSNDETEFEFYFGTNEALQWSASRHLTITSISEEDERCIRLHFDEGYGHFPDDGFNELLKKYNPIIAQ